MAKRKAALYSYSQDENYELEIEETTDLNADGFDWEEILLIPLEARGENINVSNGVGWGWV
jgi:hypothetical protein